MKIFILASLSGFIFVSVLGCKNPGRENKNSGKNECERTENSSADKGQERVSRIISMSPNLTQIVFALGAGDRLAGVDEYSRYPSAAERLPKMGSFLEPNIERIIAARPDIVLVVNSDDKIMELLDKAKIRYESFGNDNIRDILMSIERLGKILDCAPSSARILQKFEMTRNSLETKLKNAKSTGVVLVAGRSPGRLQDIYVAGKSSFIGEMLEIAGGENIFGDLDLAWPQVGIESIIAKDPDVIIDATLAKGASEEEYKTLADDWKMLPNLKAVKNNRIIIAREGWWQIPGAYLDSALMLFAHWLHPELFPDEVEDPNLKFQMTEEKNTDGGNSI